MLEDVKVGHKVCLIRMGIGSPNTHPRPESWVIAKNIEELIAKLQDMDASDIVSQIEAIPDEQTESYNLISLLDRTRQLFLLVY